jgi:hypothetical protein
MILIRQAEKKVEEAKAKFKESALIYRAKYSAYAQSLIQCSEAQDALRVQVMKKEMYVPDTDRIILDHNLIVAAAILARHQEERDMHWSLVKEELDAYDKFYAEYDRARKDLARERRLEASKRRPNVRGYMIKKQR